MANDVEIQVKGLDQILKALKAKAPTAKVGILGPKNVRKQTLTFAQVSALESKHMSTAQTNAEIGYKHEFGDPAKGIPIRSFLRTPLTDLWVKKLTDANALTPEVFQEVLRTGSILPWMEKATIVAEAIVLEGFATGGFGKWKAHSPNYHSKTGQILVDTTQLRDSITHEVKA